MTKMQEKTVEKIKAWVLENDCYMSNYEIKQFDVKQIELGQIRVYCIVGYKNDENSILRYHCRKRRKIIIRERGGISAYVYAGGKEKIYRGWNKAMILGYDNYPYNFPND